MIAFPMNDHTHGSHFAAAIHQTTSLDQKVSAVIECAEFSHRERKPNGTVVDYWILRKPVCGLPAGKVISLPKLHELLFRR